MPEENNLYWHHCDNPRCYKAVWDTVEKMANFSYLRRRILDTGGEQDTITKN
jgi:hypothetical protein